jgi:xanthine dehydrogenase accessory factor
MTQRMAGRVAELTGARVPFVHAVVVRAQHPTLARPGDDAVILADGSIEGFVGGLCAESSVRSAALAALADGRPMLLRVMPGEESGFPDVPGASVVTNPCLSGGALEIFLRPEVPAPLIGVVGSTPISEALAAVGGTAGFVIDRLDGKVPSPGTTAVIVASLGRDDESGPIRAALDAGIGFIGLVASSKRGEAVLGDLQLSADERARVHTPVGLALGAETAEEIAVSILAALVQAIRQDGLKPSAGLVATSPTPVQVVDPVCGMTVVVGPDAPHLVVDGVDRWFCGTGCREAFAAQPPG